MNTVIQVENLAKRYYIGHQSQGRYLTFRDTMAQTARDWGRRILHPFRASAGEPLGGLSTTEEFWAIKDVSFEVKQGDRVGIIGRNGAGKSTLLKLLSRITEPTSGRITLDGRVASLLEVGTGFHPELSGRENIFLNGAVLGMTKVEIKKKFDEIVAFAEVERFLDTPVKRYSSGMYVRLAFAVAAHLEPEILLVDEVLAVGDHLFQKKCLGKMAEVGRDGRTVLFVSHNMGSIQQLSLSCILLSEGELIYKGTARDTVSHYLENQSTTTRPMIENISTNDSDFSIIQVVLDTEDGRFLYQDPISISLDFAVDRVFNDINLTIGLFNSAGSRLLTAKHVFEVLKVGKHSVSLDITDHHLPPGAYAIAIGFATNSYMIFYRDNLLTFFVSDEGVDDPYLVPYLSKIRDQAGAFFHLEIKRYNRP